MIDAHERMAKARTGRRAKLLATVDPQGLLPEDERNRLADELQREQMRKAGLQSAKNRRAGQLALQAQEARRRELLDALLAAAPQCTPEQAAVLAELLPPVVPRV